MCKSVMFVWVLCGVLVAALANGLTPNGLKFEFVLVASGEFLMGSEGAERLPWRQPFFCRDPGVNQNERPAHWVLLSQPFEIGKYEVTQAQWAAVMANNPSRFKGRELPVERVSWDDVQEFLQRLNQTDDGYFYRLPTEAEWEYAAREGTTSPAAGRVKEMAFYGMNSGGRPQPVGRKQPNAWGLYDMYGNVAEWVSDLYDDEFYSISPEVNPQGPSVASLFGRPYGRKLRVLRGGAYGTPLIECCRSAIRKYGFARSRISGVGFRLVRGPSQ